jgi:hypothetical protein
VPAGHSLPRPTKIRRNPPPVCSFMCKLGSLWSRWGLGGRSVRPCETFGRSIASARSSPTMRSGHDRRHNPQPEILDPRDMAFRHRASSSHGICAPAHAPPGKRCDGLRQIESAAAPPPRLQRREDAAGALLLSTRRCARERRTGRRRGTAIAAGIDGHIYAAAATGPPGMTRYESRLRGLGQAYRSSWRLSCGKIAGLDRC